MACTACEIAAAELKKLTVGMAVADDYATAAMTIQSLRMHHGMTPDELEILVIDNKPYTPQGQRLKVFCESIGVTYSAFPDPVGTAPPHNEIFSQATGQVVCAIDSHVLLEIGVLQKLMTFARANPFNRDLWHGPLLYDQLGDARNDHLAEKWGTDFMYGVWETDERSKDPNGPPFEIPMHGMGLCACIKASWPGIPEGLKGFGGTEGMIHEVFRQRKNRVLCLPFLRWWHLFRGDWLPNPNPPMTVDKFRNYLIWYKNLALDQDILMDLFRPVLSQAEFDRAIAESQAVLPPSLETMYRQVVQHTSYINEHCSTLRRLAMDCDRVTEVVDRVGPSTVALLSGRPDKVTSYVRSTEQFGKLAAFSRGMNHEITIDADMWLPDRPHETSLLFIGACKTSADLAAVLKNCETWSSRWLVVAGLATYGDTGADGQPGMNLAMGEFLRAHTRWTAVEAHPYNNGLHVFSCDSKDKREVPSWWTSAKNYTKARFKYEMAGEPDVDEAVYDLRLHACLMCPHRNGDICSICTCPVEDKALWATEDCPDKPSRWPSLTVLSDKKEEIKPQTAEKSVKSLEEQEMDTLRAALASKTPSVTHCRHQNVTSEVEITSGETITAAIQIRCMDCSTIFSFKDRPGDPKPVFQLSTLA